MPETITAYIGLGSNQGDRKDFLEKATEMLNGLVGVDVVDKSDVIETTPLGNLAQQRYLNSVVRIKTILKPDDLLNRCNEIETSLGRVRKKKWEPRNIDLDILLYGQHIINEPNLTIPHPQMHLRWFVLKGLLQLDSKLVHPLMNEPLSKLAERLNGQNYFLDSEKPQLISIAGIIGVGKTTLTKHLAESLACDAFFEPYDTNPFITEEYAGKSEVALSCELFFLAKRAQQLNNQTLPAGKILISDYIFDKALIYAKLWLKSHQLDLYNMIYPFFAEKIARPVVVLYLKDSVESCLKRIHRRNRPYEQSLEPTFLEKLRQGYENLFANWTSSPVIPLQMAEFDCKNEKDMEYLKGQIRHYVSVKTAAQP